MEQERKPAGIGDKYIVCECSPTGETVVKAVGFKDGTCREATKDYENALGLVVSRVQTGPTCSVKADSVKIKQ